MKQRKRRLGTWQIAALDMIANQKVCCHLRIVDKVHGAAKTWDRKYMKSLKRAIEAHNSNIAINSPIDPKYFIILGACGYYLKDRSELVR